jgi:hypothetical protein
VSDSQLIIAILGSLTAIFGAIATGVGIAWRFAVARVKRSDEQLDASQKEVARLNEERVALAYARNAESSSYAARFERVAISSTDALRDANGVAHESILTVESFTEGVP